MSKTNNMDKIYKLNKMNRMNNMDQNGFFNKCFCCSFLARETSVIVCTYLMAVFILVLCVCICVFDKIDYYVIGLTVVLLLSIVGLLFGIKNRKESLLKQFKSIFGAIIILAGLGMLYFIVIQIIVIIGAGDKDTIEDYKKTIELTQEEKKYTDTEITKTIRMNSIIFILELLCTYLISAYYYITTRSYIIETIKEINNVNYSRSYNDIFYV